MEYIEGPNNNIQFRNLNEEIYKEKMMVIEDFK